MTQAELINLLEVVQQEEGPTGITVHLISNSENDELVIEQTDATDQLNEDLKDLFSNTIKNRYLNNPNFVLSDITQATDDAGTYFYDLDEFPDKLSVLTDFDPWANHSIFTITAEKIKAIKAMIITFGNDEKYFSLYKHVYPFKIWEGQKLLGLVPIGNRFDRLNETVLQINGSIDFIYSKPNLVVSNVKTFQNKYGYNEVAVNAAKERIELINDLGLIANIAELTTFVENPTQAKKMLKVNPNSPVLKLAAPAIITFIKNHPTLKKKFKFNAAGTMIRLHTKVSKESIINILNDAYLKSNLTDLDYETMNKAVLKEEGE